MLHILCLHGYRQNAKKFRVQTAAIRRSLKDIAELHYVNGPIMIESRDKAKFYAWNVDDTVQYLSDLGGTSYDGILAFSQGGTAAHEFINSTSNSIKFCIYIASTTSDDIKNSKVASFHVTGESDTVITTEQSMILYNLYDNPSIFTHSGGHYVPCTRELRLALKEFLFRFVRG